MIQLNTKKNVNKIIENNFRIDVMDNVQYRVHYNVSYNVLTNVQYNVYDHLTKHTELK